MSRSLPYRFECSEKCLQAQNDALNSTFFILRQTGPTAFVIKEDDERIFKVILNRLNFNKYILIRYSWVININVHVLHFNVIKNYVNISVGFF
jgi:hypothetical protein